MVFYGGLGPGKLHVVVGGGGGEDAFICWMRMHGLAKTVGIALTTIKHSGCTHCDAQKATVRWVGEYLICTFGWDAEP